MKIVVAMDSFKGTLPAEQACQIIKEAFVTVNPSLCIITKPIADGGEGTAHAMLAARTGQWITVNVIGPLPDMRVEAGFAWFADTQTALVEMAIASGITLLRKDELNPLKTTTYGTGELIKAAIDKKPAKILLAVGGSATTDGGVGAAMALGWKFLDAQDRPIGLGGEALSKIIQIVRPIDLKLPLVEVLCDVTNSLTGPHGAAHIFGPQKGATPQMVEQLDAGLKHLADLVKAQLGIDIDNVPGAGAAGGLAAGAIAFMNAKIVSGIETVISASGLSDELSDADWVITGEGCFDSQSLRGKVVSGIAKNVSNTTAHVGVLAGCVKLTKKDWRQFGIADVISAQQPGMSSEYAIANAERLLAEAATEFARRHFSKA
jgi:glycerate 2-kinase